MEPKKNFTYQVIRSGRRSISVEISKESEVIVRAPFRETRENIDDFVNRHHRWIENHLAKAEERKRRTGNIPKMSETELNHLVRVAKKTFAARAEYYAPLVGVDYKRITIRKQRSKWGSCTEEGNLNFNVLLMLAPPEVLDSVVVHELCHRLEMNHSPRFYNHVYRVFPEYDKWDKWLKDNGDILMSRLPSEN